MEKLSTYAQNVTSQAGEDGIIAEIMRRLDIQQGACIEFGAGDGKTISNTYTLWHNLEWSALLIEPDESEFTALEQRLVVFNGIRRQKLSDPSTLPEVLAIRGVVTHDGPLYVPATTPVIKEGIECGNTLDRIIAWASLESEKAGGVSFKDVDLLSIDIDGNDYHVWKAFRKHTAKCVVIEYTAAFPPHIDHVVTPGESMTTGSSMLALVNLGKEKGYTLVAVTKCNLVFVRNDLIELLGDVCTDPLELHDPNWCTYVIGDMSGRRAWITKKHPDHYYLESDLSLRDKVPDQSLYPIQMHRAEWDTLCGRFRLDGKDLAVFCYDTQDMYMHVEDHIDSVNISLDILHTHACNYASAESKKVPMDNHSKSAQTIQPNIDYTNETSLS
tara:strand:+ start:122 stop:1279 length:1158 start_codon:yes stop_codon:yes gene_type:complete